MNTRALAKRNRREAAKVIQKEPREEEIVESDTTGDSRGARCHSIYVFVCQVLGLEVDLQQQQFRPQSIL